MITRSNNAQRTSDWSFATCPLDLKHAILQRHGFALPDRNIESHDENFASLGWVDDRVNPEPCGGVADVGLAIVASPQLLGHVAIAPRRRLLFPGA